VSFKFKNALYLPLIIVLSSCSTPVVNNQNKSEKIDISKYESDKNEDLMTEGEIPECKGCIIGSSTTYSLKDANKKTYYLYGAEHLNLKNKYFDIPVVYNKNVKKWIKYFSGKGRARFRRYTSRAGRLAPMMSKILHEQGLPRDLIYLAMAESGFHQNAKSWAKAVGLWQFMPYTGKRFGLEINYFIDERRDPIKATKAAGRYLGMLYERFGNWELAMSSYNAGEGKMGRAIKRYRTTNFWKIIKGRYLKPETKNYVPKIMALAIMGKNLKSFGLHDIEYKDGLDFDEVEVAPNSDMYKMAETIGVDFEEIKDLNPELLRWQTPLHRSYVLKIPSGYKKDWHSVSLDIDFSAVDYKRYLLRSRARLTDVAKKFKIPKRVIASLNVNYKPSKKLPRRTAIVLPFHREHTRKNPMYSDLYERPRKSVIRRRKFKKQLARAKRKGKLVKNPSVYYTVKRGDTLWSVSRKMGVSLHTIIRSNYNKARKGRIFPGDKLAIR
jgi:membrane-bound lytic murein transglycosylase D